MRKNSIIHQTLKEKVKSRSSIHVQESMINLWWKHSTLHPKPLHEDSSKLHQGIKFKHFQIRCSLSLKGKPSILVQLHFNYQFNSRLISKLGFDLRQTPINQTYFLLSMCRELSQKLWVRNLVEWMVIIRLNFWRCEMQRTRTTSSLSPRNFWWSFDSGFCASSWSRKNLIYMPMIFRGWRKLAPLNLDNLS